MFSILRLFLAPCALLLFVGPVLAAGIPVGTYETARGEGGDRLYLSLDAGGRAKIIEEYDFQIPGRPGKRHGRSTTFAKWKQKGADLILTYAKRDERLAYSERMSLKELELPGTAAALKARGPADAKSRIGLNTLWRAPHDYKRPVKAAAQPAPAPAPAAPGDSAPSAAEAPAPSAPAPSAEPAPAK